MTVRTWTNAALLAIALGFVIWAARFIEATSLVALDGRRYFALFDDAMISMRYAWNLAHGHGLVWNSGERVEGYTNLLMALVMAIPNALVEQRLAVLSVQAFGVVTMIGIAALTGQIAAWLVPDAPPQARAVVRLAGFAAVLLYYPLAYWSLMGMETGLLTLLLLAAAAALLVYRQNGDLRWARGMAVLLGLCYLTRPESLALAGLMLLTLLATVYTAPARIAWRQVVAVGVLFAALPLAQHIFRWWYYDGALFANTYTLKAEGLPLDEQIGYGWDYTAPFLREHALLLALAAAGVLLRRRIEMALFGAMAAVMIAYQIAVGGDVPAWTYWRMTAPVMPLVFALAIAALVTIARVRPVWWAATGAAVAGGIAFGVAVGRFWPEMTFAVPPYQAPLNAINVDTALLIDTVTTPDASLGVFWAGTIPYYNPERYAIDYLGKSDPYVAALTPDPDDPMRGWPGHNKRDLAYSIQTLQPTYSEEFAIGNSDIRAWGREHYTALVHSQNRDLVLFFKTGDPAVNWAAALERGLFPWMGWNVDAFFADWPESAGTIFIPANTLGLNTPAVGPEAFSGAAAEALAAWERSRLPDDLRAAGVDYLLVDHAWWAGLSEAERAVLSDPAQYEPVREWRVEYVFVRLLRVGDTTGAANTTAADHPPSSILPPERGKDDKQMLPFPPFAWGKGSGDGGQPNSKYGCSTRGQ